MKRRGGGRADEMRKYHIQRKIAIVIALVGLFVAVVNLVDDIPERPFWEAFIDIDVSLVLLLGIVMLITGFINSVIIRVSQVLVFLLAAGIAMLDVYDAVFGLGFVLLAIFLSFSYGFFERRGIIKFMAIVIYLFGMAVLSASLQYERGHVMLGLDMVAYLAMFLLISYLIYSDEINAYLSRARAAENALSALQAERENLAARLSALDEKIRVIEERRSRIDLDKAGITAREREVLRVLIRYRETEQQIAKRLGISPFTVKEHFRHIRDKLGVDRREEIIEICRNLFDEE